MLTADLVRVRRSGKTLSVVPLTHKTRPRALELAERYMALLASSVGGTYAELKETWSAVDVAPREKKLALGLQKLIEDQLELDTESPVEPRKLRSLVFLKAAALRRSTPHDFQREAILREVFAALGLQPELELPSAEDALFADLKSQHRIRKLPELASQSLIERYEVAQYQAVLLRATKVNARVTCKSAASYRELFRALKFRRLLHKIERDGDGYAIEIDGPFSLFESVTKYGLQLALVFPRLLACDSVDLKAELRWGKARTPLTFGYESTKPFVDEQPAPEHDEIEDLKQRFTELGSAYEVTRNDVVLDLPGVGVIVPDLVFKKGRQEIYFELLGFWSRDAVWKRVELVEKGLPQRVLFAASSRLRVSENVLDDEEHGALYVFKGVMNPKRVLEKLDRLLLA